MIVKIRFDFMIGNLRVTTLVDNHVLAGTRIHAEHGLSFLVEADGEKILFDTGHIAEVLAHNLDTLNIDFRDLVHIVLSHGHYDHTGGLKEIAKRVEKASLFAHPGILDDKYVKRGENYIPIGMPIDVNELTRSLDLQLNEKAMEIIDGVWTTGQIPRITGFEHVPDMYRIKKNGMYAKDDILDDQALILDTKKGLVVILGCTHSGVVNTLNHVKEITGKKEIFGIMGGMHLRAANEARLRQTSRILNRSNVHIIGLSHCSGENTFYHLKNLFGDNVFLNYAGSVIEI